MWILFPVSLFLSAVLLFCIQPMAAKVLLPLYGGTPAVWIICMLFFQLLLLVAYGYAWLLAHLPRARIWPFMHGLMALLTFFALPVMFQPTPSLHIPEWGILWSLFYHLGLPLLIIGASAPLLQFAYSRTEEKHAADPYFLYVASNIGSLLALLSYPWLIERFLGLKTQFQLWTAGYIVYLVLLACLLLGWKYQPRESIVKKQSHYTDISWWIFLSFIPCSLMLGVTFYITTDVAPTPLFWVLPLSLYLLSFIVTFSRSPLIPHRWVVRNTVFVLIFPVLGFIFGESQILAWQMVLFNLVGFFMLALLCHGELIRRRPGPEGLTLFYFCIALGGVLAGIFNGLMAPRLFSQPYEYPLLIVLSLLVLPIKRFQREWWMPFTVLIILLLSHYLAGISSLQILKRWHIGEIAALLVATIWQQSARSISLAFAILFIFLFVPWFKHSDVLLQQRNFYGIKQVIAKGNVHALMSQTTIHGFQLLNNPESLKGTLAYYGAVEPVIDVFKQQNGVLKTTIMGLGAGILVCQFRNTDRLSLIEIDSQVLHIAKNPNYFTYLSFCPSEQTLINDDGRLALAKMKNHSQDLIVVDAFSSDAIPVHLLTREAFTLYRQKMTEDGAILVNISNRHLELLPVLTASGRANDLIVLELVHKGDKRLGQFDSQWVLLTLNEPLAFQLINRFGWRFVADNSTYLWTDDYSNLIPLLKW
ncbi:spermidine synthase [Legionella israelensis]|uniref:spermidine synthase n=1 Tax=Legionella israelensis TaxID=454 RepID=UPI001180EE3C|nr:fused MFS/spermidine synthase [Legionella israelensis]QDP73489.1 spermidine synthase [Legionella israelensis]